MPSARKLGKKTDQRRAMLRGMVTLLLDKGRIETTFCRAKELQRVADKMITIGKKNTLAAKRAALAYITKEEVVKKLFDIIAPSFEDRNGGYTRVLKLGPRRGDGAEMAIIELVNYAPKIKTDKKSAKAKDAKEEVKEDVKDAKEVKEVKEKTEKTEKTEKAEAKEKPKRAAKPRVAKEKEVKETKEEVKEEIKEVEVVEEIEEIEEVIVADEVDDAEDAVEEVEDKNEE